MCHVESQEKLALTFENHCSYVQLTLSSQNSTNDVLSNSPKWFPTFLLNSLGEFSFSCWIAFYVINSYILTTKQLIFYCYCKEKIDVDKLAGAERVKECLVHSMHINCSVSSSTLSYNFLLETASLTFIFCLVSFFRNQFGLD